MIKSPTRLRRGTTRGKLNLALGRDFGYRFSDDDIKLLAGKTVTNKSYISTTFKKTNEFIEDGNVLIEFIADENTKGGYLDGFSQFSYEEEFLLPRGSKYVIEHAEKEGDLIHVYARILGNEE